MTTQNETRLELPAVADLTHAEGLKEALLIALTEGKRIVIEAGNVQRMGSPCFQVLAAAAKTCAEAGAPLPVFANPSAHFRECALLLGLDAVLKLDEALP